MRSLVDYWGHRLLILFADITGVHRCDIIDDVGVVLDAIQESFLVNDQIDRASSVRCKLSEDDVLCDTG